MEATMYKWSALILGVFFLLLSCGDSDLPEDNTAVSAKILAIRIQEVESLPGDTISLSLLIGGKEIDQNSDIPVRWNIGSPEDAFYYSEVVPYNEDGHLTLPDMLPAGVTWVDIPVTAAVLVNGKSLSSLKRFRITENPLGKNPRISGITLNWMMNGIAQTTTLSLGETLVIDSSTRNIACTVLTQTLSDGANDKLVYRWYVSTSKSGNGVLKVNDEKTDVEALLGSGALAADFRESVVFSLYGDEAKEAWQSGIYDIYCVVRDNASESQSTEQDRLGTDFYFFTLEVQ